MPELAAASPNRPRARRALLSPGGSRTALLAATIGGEILRESPLRRLPWLGTGPEQVLETAADELDWPGVLLPPVVIADGLVAPVVMARPDVWHGRMRGEIGPVVDRALWRDWGLDGYAGAPEQVIDVVGFLVVGRLLGQVRSTCARLRPTAPVAALVPAVFEERRAQDRQVELMRCDYLGIPVLTARGTDVSSVIIQDRWRPHGGPVHFQQRLRSEQLFELALRSGYWPDDPYSL